MLALLAWVGLAQPPWRILQSLGPHPIRGQSAIAVEHVELCGLVQLIPNRKERTSLRLGHLCCSSRDTYDQHVLHAVFHVAKTGRLVAQAAIDRPQDL